MEMESPIVHRWESRCNQQTFVLTEKGKTMRLIDADALMKIVDAEIDRVEEEILDAKERPILYTDDFRKCKSYTAVGMCHIAQDILEAPSVDAVPVVRCGECKYSDWYTVMNGKHLCYCTEHGSSGHNESDYCSYGEREDDE